MRTRTPLVVGICLGFAIQLAGASIARAQFGRHRAPEPATGENYHVEIFGGLWKPDPEITVSSDRLGIAGTDIDVVNDLGFPQRRFREFRLVVRPARKHKFRVQFVPISYRSDTLLERPVVFNGVRYSLGIPITAAARWNTWRFGYEYDFLTRDRWFVGFIAEAKYTDIDVALDTALLTEVSSAQAPVPAVGGIARVYVARNVGLTFELTGFKLPNSVSDRYSVRYVDLDVYGTVNFTDHAGVQIGYRSIDALYRISEDAGDLKLTGVYFGGLLRF